MPMGPFARDCGSGDCGGIDSGSECSSFAVVIFCVCTKSPLPLFLFVSFPRVSVTVYAGSFFSVALPAFLVGKGWDFLDCSFSVWLGSVDLGNSFSLFLFL